MMSGEAWLYLLAVLINAVNLFLQVFFTIMYSDLEWYVDISITVSNGKNDWSDKQCNGRPSVDWNRMKHDTTGTVMLTIMLGTVTT